MTLKRIGFVGLGNMGRPMVRRLAEAGYEVHAFDVSPEARQQVADIPGVSVHTDLGATATGTDAIILMLPDSDIVEQVLVHNGLLAALAAATFVVDMSSSEPARTRELAHRAAEHDVVLVDAPVSGGVSGAERGALTMMVGGSDEAVATIRPLLGVFGSQILHAGGVGSGHAVKALNNLMSATHLLVSSEAILAGERFGIDPAVILEIVNVSTGRSGSTQTKWPNFILTKRFDSRFGLRLMLKDMKIALKLAQQSGIPTFLSEAAVAAWSDASDKLPADADHTEIARWLELTATEPVSTN